jgi:AbiU2
VTFRQRHGSAVALSRRRVLESLHFRRQFCYTVNALYGNTSGTFNVATGTQALLNNTTGFSNTAIDFDALANKSGRAVMEDAIKKLESQVEALFMLTINAFGRLRFLRPMLDNRKLLDRIEQENRAGGFSKLRNWLYWALVLELAKLCHDNGKQKRAPSIYAIREKLKNPELVQALEDKYAKNNRGMAESEELTKEFRTIYRRFCENADRMLSEAAAGGYKTIRDKLIAHNELRKDGKFHDVTDEKLKYGDERTLLETISNLVTDLELLVRKTDVQSVWSSTLAFDQEIVFEFWELGHSEEPTKT